MATYNPGIRASVESHDQIAHKARSAVAAQVKVIRIRLLRPALAAMEEGIFLLRPFGLLDTNIQAATTL